LLVVLVNVDPSGGQHITAGITGIQIQTKMYIHHRQEVSFGVIPYGL
jgi:hypothetical protein